MHTTMQRKARYDAVVIGARCAGAATAMLMARQGQRVLLVDRAGYGTDALSTHALMRGGVLQLARWGLLRRLQQAGTPAIRTTTFHYGAESIEVEIKPDPLVPALYAPRRTLLDSVLVDAAAAAGAEVWHGPTLVGLRHGADGRVTGARLLSASGAQYDVAAGLVVGADGLGSSVARLVAAPVRRQARHATAAVFGYWAGLPHAGNHWHYAPGASVGVIPTNAGEHCVFVSVPPARFRAAFRADRAGAYHAVLREVAPTLAEAVAGARQASPLHAFAGRRGFFRKAHGPGWALVGDAGYFKDPLTAHGITDALRDAELLAEVALHGTPAAFATYETTRDALSLPVFEATDAIASFEWDLAGVQALHRALNRAMKPEVEHLMARADHASVAMEHAA
ncbi:FAD-dependent oxidoreductase [Falsiroseomonas sp. E2-1-a20]|uniref:FAD-dependent oxidoreductase n=1 Tax=Falsiroseomonas sp. E2-1-a20 TaxID=3239300 RepID=UPI003F2E6780